MSLRITLFQWNKTSNHFASFISVAPFKHRTPSPLIRAYSTKGVVPSSNSIPDGTSVDILSKSFEQLKAQQQEEEEPKKKHYRTRQKDESWATVKQITVSIKKLREVVQALPGLSYQEAVKLLKNSPQRIARGEVFKAVHDCRWNAENNHNLDPDRLVISEAWVGRDTGTLKRLNIQGRGHVGILQRRRSRMTVIMKEIPYVPTEKKLGKYGENHKPEYHARYQEKIKEKSKAEEAKSTDKTKTVEPNESTRPNRPRSETVK